MTPTETTLPDAPLQDGSTIEDMTLEDLAKATDNAVVAEMRRTAREENSRVTQAGGDKLQEGGGGTRTLATGGRRQGSGGERCIVQRENSRRGAGSRRGTTQQEDDECSLYFRSDSVCEGHRMPYPSRRTSTASSGGVGGKGKRTIYLGRAQAFPLRRVESSLAVDARGFGLSGVSPEIIGGEATHLLDVVCHVSLTRAHYTSDFSFVCGGNKLCVSRQMYCTRLTRV